METQKNERRRKLIEKYYSNKIKNFEVIIDNVWNVHNVAAILRSADALGVEKINMYYTYNKFPDLVRHGKKASATAKKWIKLEKIKNLSDFVKEKKKQGFVFISADIKKDAKLLTEYQFPDKVILILGSEKEGVSKELKEIADETVFIPMVGMVQSYNVSVTAAIFFYEIFKQKGKGLKLRQEIIED